MDFALSEDQQAFVDAARQFAANEMAPNAEKWDAEKIFPISTMRDAAALGFAAIYVREDVGGSGLGRVDAALIFEELAAACPSTAAYLSIHNMVSWIIDNWGTEDQRRTYLPRLATMDLIASYCLTEPNAGSDAASLKTKAERDGDFYVLNGSKAFISGGGTSDIYAVMCRTGGEGAGGVSCIVVEKGTEGLSFGAPEKKMGWNSQPTAVVNFDNCRVPIANLMGQEGEGFEIAMKGLDGGRLNIGACSLGGAQAAIRAAKEHMGVRKQFGRTLDKFQALQFKLADMVTDYEAARLVLHKAAWMLDNKHPDATKHCAMAKRLATDLGFRIVDEALQLHGGYGYIQDYGMERLLRDLRVHRILEGTNEIMRVIVSRAELSD